MALSEILSPVKIVRHLREDGSAATLNRLLSSRHVADLRLILSLTLYAVAFCFVLAAIFEGAHIIWDGTPAYPQHPHGLKSWMALASNAIIDSGPFVGAVFAIGCAVAGWAFQSGSARLGIVDLFACEITTLCRVFTIVDLVRRYVDAFNADLAQGAGPAPDPETIERIHHWFDHDPGSETYTPVFDQNASDLRVLDATVVTNVTAFYTYLKAMKDALRNLARIPAPAAGATPHDAWHEGLATVLYMQFLMLESARKAVHDLIEFEPNQVENTVTILIGELCAYRFLLHQYATEPASPDLPRASGRAGVDEPALAMAAADDADATAGSWGFRAMRGARSIGGVEARLGTGDRQRSEAGPRARGELAAQTRLDMTQGITGPEDFRHARLRIRGPAYRSIVGQAWWRAKEGERSWSAQEAAAQLDVARQIAGATDPSHADVSYRSRERLSDAHRRVQQWRRAAETANELANRYAALFPGEPIDRPDDLPSQPQDAPRAPARSRIRRRRRRLRRARVE